MSRQSSGEVSIGLIAALWIIGLPAWAAAVFMANLNLTSGGAIWEPSNPTGAAAPCGMAIWLAGGPLMFTLLAIRRRSRTAARISLAALTAALTVPAGLLGWFALATHRHW